MKHFLGWSAPGDPFSWVIVPPPWSRFFPVVSNCLKLIVTIWMFFTFWACRMWYFRYSTSCGRLSWWNRKSFCSCGRDAMTSSEGKKTVTGWYIPSFNRSITPVSWNRRTEIITERIQNRSHCLKWARMICSPDQYRSGPHSLQRPTTPPSRRSFLFYIVSLKEFKWTNRWRKDHVLERAEWRSVQWCLDSQQTTSGLLFLLPCRDFGHGLLVWGFHLVLFSLLYHYMSLQEEGSSSWSSSGSF